MIILLSIILAITILNSLFLWLLFYRINQNWEGIIDLRNDINTLDRTIYYSRNGREFK